MISAEEVEKLVYEFLRFNIFCVTCEGDVNLPPGVGDRVRGNMEDAETISRVREELAKFHTAAEPTILDLAVMSNEPTDGELFAVSRMLNFVAIRQ